MKDRDCKICKKYISRFDEIDDENVKCPHCKYKFNLKIDNEYLDNWISAHAAYVKKTMEKLNKSKEVIEEKTAGMGIKCKIIVI